MTQNKDEALRMQPPLYYNTYIPLRWHCRIGIALRTLKTLSLMNLCPDHISRTESPNPLAKFCRNASCTYNSCLIYEYYSNGLSVRLTCNVNHEIQCNFNLMQARTLLLYIVRNASFTYK